MLFKEFGDKTKPVVVLLHGGGLSWWSCKPVIRLLADDCFVVAPIIDGHGEDGGTEFMSIEDSAKKLIAYIDANFGGKIYAIAGLSLGAQIAAEVLSQRSDIAKYAVIESALLIPIKGVTSLAAVNGLFYGLIKHKWFAKIQSRALFVPDEMFESYYEDSLKFSKQSLISLSLSNGNYRLKDTIADTNAKVLVVVGEKELGIMKKSAKMLHERISGSELFSAESMKHGEFSLLHPEAYAEALKKLFKK